MPYEVKASRMNQTVIVQLTTKDGEKPVQLRNAKIAYSTTLTADMRTQKKLGYIDYKFLKSAPEDKTKPDGGQSQLMAKVDQHEATARGEANPPPKTEPEYYTEAELRKMRKGKLKELAEASGLDSDMNKDDLLEELLQYDIPKE